MNDELKAARLKLAEEKAIFKHEQDAKKLETSTLSMHVYDVSIIDFFNGLIPLDKYIAELEDDEPYQGSKEEQIINLKRFVLECFSNCLMTENYWEIDVSNGVYVGALPDSETLSTKLFLVFKQSNNGSTFMTCPFELPYLKHQRCKPHPQHYTGLVNNSDKFLERYLKVIDLVEELFSHN